MGRGTEAVGAEMAITSERGMGVGDPPPPPSSAARIASRGFSPQQRPRGRSRGGLGGTAGAYCTSAVHPEAP